MITGGWHPYPETEPPAHGHFEAKVKDPTTGEESVTILFFDRVPKWFESLGPNPGKPVENVVAWGVMGTARRERENKG